MGDRRLYTMTTLKKQSVAKLFCEEPGGTVRQVATSEDTIFLEETGNAEWGLFESIVENMRVGDAIKFPGHDPMVVVWPGIA